LLALQIPSRGQTYVITNLISALWRVSLTLPLKRSLLNRKYILINVLKAWLQSFLCTVEAYTEIFYTFDEDGILSPQCKMSLRRTKSMRKLDGPSLIFIDF
jgi:hypothetical protein